MNVIDHRCRIQILSAASLLSRLPEKCRARIQEHLKRVEMALRQRRLAKDICGEALGNQFSAVANEPARVVVRRGENSGETPYWPASFEDHYVKRVNKGSRINRWISYCKCCDGFHFSML